MVKMSAGDLKFKDSAPKIVASSRMVKASPRKLNMVLKAIRGRNTEAALATLSFCRRAVAYDVSKVLRSAMSNAENNHLLDSSSMCVREAFVGKAMMLKRFSPRAKGRGVRIRRRFSKFTVVLGELED